MLDRSQIITPENHPKDCFVFVQRAETVSVFLRDADRLVLGGEHRIICWRPPSGEDIFKLLSEKGSQNQIDLLEKNTHSSIASDFNMHLDDGVYDHSGSIILNGAVVNLTQTQKIPEHDADIGTPLFFLAAGNIALLLPKQFGSQATLHGFPVRKNSHDKRKTCIATIQPTALRQA